MKNYKELVDILEKEPLLIEIDSDINNVIVGDTHGDLEATKEVIRRYPLDKNRDIFIGDYVDRGPNSKGNIDYLFEMKQKYPNNLILLLGNHDFVDIPCYPADFWDSLSNEEKKEYGGVLQKLPLAVSVDGILALHGALPKIKDINEINKINKNNSTNLIATIWGNFVEHPGGFRGYNAKTGRPEFGRGYFDITMANIGKSILIRGHQSNAPEIMYDNRCLAIFTSCAYNRPRRIAVLEKKKKVRSIKDIKIETV